MIVTVAVTVILTLGAVALAAFLALFFIATGTFPKLRFPGPLDGPGDE